MAGRREVRQAAFLLSFEKLFMDDELENIFNSAQELGEFISVDDEVKALVRGIFEKQDELDSIISKYSDKRAVSRIPKVDLSVLRLAIYEALYDDKVPVNVAISEAVSLTEKYALEPDIAFVNGLLGSFAKDIKKDED
ncbi:MULTISPECIES: transcription antitermination factor NusB [Ruminococcus]|uniref:Transcription antitermination protein NusB n=1 Tax=Ruminococcus albus (strain ATCC 27210 / DSM 20455 / JCM 14654 / NCDO 2250 / 7) TaxID=697329 RepID=E6UAP0_RUMA7|nr:MULTISPECIES: transcription antitermination factor NusB [Ruminococcus]ADU22462.1 NusB antitermination factor [Ruminococcus albus 7 = DSM 20455]MCR5022574.1 transcription antitermination factor NusB [Ruminococcus sp.]